MRQRHFHPLQPSTWLDRWRAYLRASHASPREASHRRPDVDEYALACIASAGICPWVPFIDVNWDELAAYADDDARVAS